MHRTIVIFRIPTGTGPTISDEWLDSIRSRQPEFRTEKMKRYKEEYDIPEYDIDIITGSKHLQISLKLPWHWEASPRRCPTG